MADEDESILAKLDSIAPMQKFDAFPKLPATYKAKTTGGGFWTLIAILASILLVMNDLHEFIWGWPDYEFDVDTQVAKTMVLNVDMIVNMRCHYLSVDLRDAVGERLHLSNSFRRDGTIFDPNQARALQDWQIQRQIAAREVVAQSRRSRGLFAWLWNGMEARSFPPTYNYRPDGSACRVYGSVEVKKVTANLHITTLGHGYAGREHTDHSLMNLSHIITEFSFGPHFPDIVQPLDYSFEITEQPFSIFQYFITVVPTTYYASRTRSVRTNQYSVTHYVRHVQHGQGPPGVFFRFDIDPMAVQIHQRTTLFHDFFIRVAGVIGGVWVCARWAFKVGSKTAEVVTGKKDDSEILVEEAKSTARRGLWTGGSLNKRPQRMGGWDGADPLGSASAASPGWSPSVGLSSPYAPNPYGAAPAGAVSASGFPPQSPFVGQTRTPSGGSGWNVPAPPALAPTPSGFPPSPMPPPSPYAPAVGFAAAQLPQQTPSYGPGANRQSSASSYGSRPSSSLNPNRGSPNLGTVSLGARSISGGSVSDVTNEQKDD